MEKIYEAHMKEFGEKPQVVGEVPGICTLFGSFSDLCGGFSLVGTAFTILRIAVSKRDDDAVRMYNATLNDRKRFTLPSIKYRKEDRWANFIKGVMYTLAADGHVFQGMNFTVEGNLLLGDQMSVSSALSLGTCMVLDALYRMKLDPQTIIRIAYQSNISFNDKPCRITDLLAMLNCKKDNLLFYDLSMVKSSLIPFPFSDPQGEYVAIVVDSKISPVAMREEMKSKREDTKAAFQALKKIKPNGPIRDFPEGDLHARAVSLPESMRHICTYVLMESHLVQDAAGLIIKKDAPGLGKVMGRIQNGFRDLMEITCPEVDWLIKRASETQGCLGAVQVSNGLAGNILLLLSKDVVPQYISRMEEYEHIFGFHPKWHVYQSQDGAKIVQPTA
ncbi:MAG: galactokinase [Sphaerochaeta sp.]|jgi:galactokinase|nr:galactokinase [Sphaerochaeta sp.]